MLSYAIPIRKIRGDTVDIGAQLKKVRKEKKISVYKLSKDADISENHIHGIEKGKNQPSIAVLEILLGNLGITLHEFFKACDTTAQPTDLETEILSVIRRLPEEKAQAVLLMARLLSQ